MPDVNQKKKQLPDMQMPLPPDVPAPTGTGTVTPPDSTMGVAQNSVPGTYTDPDTGKVGEEPGAKEGDLYFDYVAPLKSLFTGGIAAAGTMAANAAARKGIGALRSRMPTKDQEEGEAPSITYDPRWQQGAGKATQATTGFSKGPGYKIRNGDEEDLDFTSPKAP